MIFFRESTVRNTNMSEKKCISHNVIEDVVTNERFVNLEPRKTVTHYTTQEVCKDIVMHHDDIEVIERTVEKEIEVNFFF